MIFRKAATSKIDAVRVVSAAGAAALASRWEAAAWASAAIVVLGLIGWALGIDPSILIGGAEMSDQPQPATGAGALHGATHGYTAG